MSLAEGKVGNPGFIASGTQTSNRFDTSNSLVCTQGHGTYTEASRRGAIFMVSTNQIVGVVAAAAHISPVAAAAVTLLTLYNPLESGKELSILRIAGDFISGTVEAGSYVLNFHPSCSITAAANANQKCLRAGSSAYVLTASIGVAKGFTATALTGGTAGVEGPLLGSFAVAGTQHIDLRVDGSYTIPQGCAVTVASPTNGTSAYTSWCIEYEELAIV